MTEQRQSMPTATADNKTRFRLVTRSDFDGLVCAALLKELDLIDDILFVHPKDMQDGKVDITPQDITTNLPYAPNCHLAFDHHKSEILRRESDNTRFYLLGEQHVEMPSNHIIDPNAPSAARVVYDYYGGAKTFPNIPEDLMVAVDKADSAQYDHEDIVDPKGWVLLNYLMDARTGLGRFKNFRISNYQLMMLLIDYCRTHSVEEILELPDVKERVELYNQHRQDAEEQLRRCATAHNHLVVLDLRHEEVIYPTNRFLIYALFPACSISMHVMWGKQQQNIVFAMGKSILNRTSKTDVGKLALIFGGGGHEAAGTCQVELNDSAYVLGSLIRRILHDG